jgi:hypothetical protein
LHQHEGNTQEFAKINRDTFPEPAAKGNLAIAALGLQPSMVSYEKLLNVLPSGLCKFTDPNYNSLAFWGILGSFASEKFPTFIKIGDAS